MIKGRVIKLGDNIDTDVIYPGKYLPIIEASEMAAHALEGIDPSFPERIGRGDIIVAGSNFGCGSSREQAATCLAAAGIGAVVAKSFSRIFYRNAINQGLPPIECAQAADMIEEGEEVEVDLAGGQLRYSGGSLSFAALPEFVMEILNDGGLIAHTKKVMGKA
ncbi:3-isopropylmalate dehydratase [candidate division TA06 bacterium DG_24]|uniref:3-isopropylmalate dehydratase small subunit n=3 Tax=Bacteria division TA06 TaxID=1156500 RepID=A0A0S8JEY7_UNCT6|nr:MAG: 3-isopropylmalate dehydratase [candidate division TA06 bacterium DG_24]KPK69718.1 MAG: 3-isopropylmalate dehydratase [candidate division TA06 bacterium SM23_40]KPL08340.1 MAG: 3-isopropylmalate dehydratase [candidate division TA06 bacterium SM1_40]